MKYSIELEPPFAYSSYWYAVGIGLILLSVLIAFLLKRLFAVRINSPLKLDRLHRESLARIDEIEKAYAGNELDTRAVHQKMSREVRQFIRDVTGLNTGNMNYEELSRLGRPEYAQLIRKYYGPEFASRPIADTPASINSGKDLINEIYTRADNERKLNAVTAYRSGKNERLGMLMRVVPRILRSRVLDSIRHNSFQWMESIETAYRNKELDPYGVYEQMCKPVHSFVRAATGSRDEASAEAALMKPALAEMADLVKEFYNPEAACRTDAAAHSCIIKGKELTEKWV